MTVTVDKKRAVELATVKEIIRIYCKGHKHTQAAGQELCPDCEAMAIYARQRLERCPRMAVKTFCSVCPIHCYGQAEAAKIKEMMRYGGPRMLWHHPLLALRHIFIEWRTKHGLRKKEAVVRR